MVTRYFLLGPVRAERDGRPVLPSRRRERALLAVLLLGLNEAVPVGRLLDLLWDGDPPDSARASLHSHVSRLRTSLGTRLDARAGGYAIEADRDAVDAHRFTAMLASAGRTADPVARAALLRRGLAEWHGAALADAGSDMLRQRVAGELDELRYAATELLIDAELESGRHREVLGDLAALVAEYPSRERLWARWALALYRSGRQVEALDALARARSRLVAEFGLEPGPELDRLQRRILTGDPGLERSFPAVAEVVVAPSSALLAPRQLPMDIAHFAGRERELYRLERLAERAARAATTAPVVCSIEGMAGVGKTRLAIHAAHRMVRRGWFDEVQLWADLHGFDPHGSRAEPAAVLETFLRLLGVPVQRIPDDLEGRAALFRGCLAGRRALLLLDNAADEKQVRPLLPGSAGCLVLITSRHRLSGLDGVELVPLEVFTAVESVALLSAVVGASRVAAAPVDASRIARLCGHLPLALALAARRLQARPGWAVGDLADRLATKGQRLGQLRVGQQALHAAFQLSYEALPAELRRCFRLIGLHPGDDVTPQEAAALLGEEAGMPGAEASLEALLDEHLLLQRVPGRYQLHDLMRLYARERAESEEPAAARYAALRRLVSSYLASARAATRRLHPAEARRAGPPDAGNEVTFATPAAALAWTEDNLTNLVETVRHVTDLPGDVPEDLLRLVVELVSALFRPLANRGHSPRRIELCRLAERAARRAGDPAGEAQALEDLGTLCGQVGRLHEALVHLRLALARWRALADPVGTAGALIGIGITYRQLGRFDEAIMNLERAAAIGRAAGHHASEIGALNQLGLAYQGAGDFAAAIERQTRGLDICRRIGDRHGEAIARANLGWAYQRSGRPGTALPLHREALALFRERGDRYNEAEQLWAIGLVYRAGGDDDRARPAWRRSIVMLREIGLLDGDRAEQLLAQPVPETPEIIRLNS